MVLSGAGPFRVFLLPDRMRLVYRDAASCSITSGRHLRSARRAAAFHRHDNDCWIIRFRLSRMMTMK
jgi:hypothetical protein